MAFNLRNRNFLKLLDFTPAEIKYLLTLSADLKAAKYAGLSVHQRRDNAPLPHPVAEDSAPEQVAR